MTRQWSTYQHAIFDAVEHDRRNLAVSAVAGSGKTTTLVEISNRLARNARAVFLAFNKHIVGELAARMKSVDCMTIHSLGLKACSSGYGKGRVKVDQYKMSDLIKDLLDDAQDVPLPVYGQFTRAATEIADKARLTVTDLSDADATAHMIDHFGILSDLTTAAQQAEISIDYLESRAVRIAHKALRKGVRIYQERGVIDFTDMIYLPAALKLSVPQYDVVLIDEAQDLNAAQLSVVLAAAGKSGRIISVADRFQAIQGFAGAANDSFDRIVSATEAHELPLSVCYRCPRSHIDLARSIVPHIEAAPNAAEGAVEHITLNLADQLVRQGDLFLCRTNAPLVGAALKLIAKGVQARVRGRNIASGLVKMIDDAGRLAVAFESSWRGTFTKQLNHLVDVRLEMLQQKEHSETAQETLADQSECIFTFLEGAPDITDADTLKTRLTALFADESAAVWLSSIHRAKGLEADRVFILRPDKIEMSHKNMQEWQREQERNLHYVALTRARKALYFVHDEAGKDGAGAQQAPAPAAATVGANRLTQPALFAQ